MYEIVYRNSIGKETPLRSRQGGAPLLGLTVALCVLLLSACGSTPQVVDIGGAQTDTVERPWGTVKTFPTMQKAQDPTPTEIDFVRQMITHHEQAVVLSDSVLKHDRIEPRVIASAQFIKQDQTNEIAAMRAWLKAWKADEAGGHHSSHTHDGMPGMVSEDKIVNLAAMSTDDAPSAFVTLMIFHHEGAVKMSQDFLADANNTFVLNIAQHMIREQTLEISYLQQLSTEL